MKRSDVISILLIAGFFMVISYFTATYVMSNSGKQSVTVKTIEAINDSVPSPDTTYFNSNAINPSVQINVGSGS